VEIRRFRLLDLWRWRSFVSVRTVLPSRRVREVLTSYFREGYEEHPADGYGEAREFQSVHRQGKIDVRVVLQTRVEDAGDERVLHLVLEARTSLWIPTMVLAVFLVGALPIGALEGGQALKFSVAFTGLYACAHWAAAWLVARRVSRQLSEDLTDRLGRPDM